MLINKINRIFEQRDILLCMALFLAFLPTVGLFPYWFSTDPTSASAASVAGYNNSIAHLLVVILSASVLILCAILEWRGYFRSEESGEPARATVRKSAASWLRPAFMLEAVVVFLVFLVLYFPTFLSKYGPYMEDSYFLTVLHRMQGGQRPYVDFETLYGPLLLYPADYFTNAAGYSMISYFTLLALLEAAQFTLLIILLQRYLPKFHIRLGVFLIFTVFLFNTLLGLNWNGIRRLSPAIIILIVASRPRAKAHILLASLLIGLLLGYSHDFGIICLLAVLAIYGLMFIRERGLKSLVPAFVIGVLSISIWFVSTILVLDVTFPAYIEAARNGMIRFSVEASFPFYWTLNSLVTFAFLSLTIVIVGRGLGRLANTRPAAGDYLLFAGLVYALLGFKSGLNRADMWHIASPMLVIILAFTLPLPRQMFLYTRQIHRLAIMMILLMAGTYLIALAPSGSFYGRGWLLGLRDTVFATRSSVKMQVVTRAPTIEPERTNPDRDLIDLGAYLGDPIRRDRPVVLYGKLWGIDKRIGVYKTTYPTDDFLLSDESGNDLKNYLREHKNALVVIDRESYERLFNPSSRAGRVSPLYSQTLTKRILSWTSTIHYITANLENEQKTKRWARTVGVYLAANYRRIDEFGAFVVLEALK